MMFGSHVDEALEKAGKRSKSEKGAMFFRQRELDKWLTLPGEDTKGRFRDPAADPRVKRVKPQTAGPGKDVKQNG